MTFNHMIVKNNKLVIRYMFKNSLRKVHTKRKSTFWQRLFTIGNKQLILTNLKILKNYLSMNKRLGFNVYDGI